MKHRIYAAAMSALVIFVGTIEPAWSEVWMNSAVRLNGEDKGNFFFALNPDGKVVFMREEFEQLGIKNIPVIPTVGKDGYISLAPYVTAVFDKQTSVLLMTVDTEGNDKPVVKMDVQSGQDLAELIIANVHINGEDKGDFFLLLNSAHELLFANEDLPRLGMDTKTWERSTVNEGYARIPPSVTATLDDDKLVLKLIAGTEYFSSSLIDMSRKHQDADRLWSGDGSGFINYGVSYNVDNNHEFTSMSVPLEAGLTVKGVLALSSFSYKKDRDEEKTVRLMSSLVKDLPARRTRLIAGDYSASSGMLGSGGLFAGVSVATKFSMDPYSVHYPGAYLYGAVNSPSDVDVYVNGLLVGKQHLSPGEFEFTNVGSVQGAGEATLVLTDAYGQKETITVPYYASSQLLKPGLHDYSYSLGYQREEYGQESSVYGDAALSGTHRVGLTRAFTAGARAEGDEDVINGGMSATFLLGSIGEFDLSYASSRELESSGDAWSARFSRASKYLSGSIFARSYSRDYANLRLSAADDKARLERSANLGFHQKQVGTLSLFYSAKDMYEEIDRERYGIRYSRRLLADVSFNIVAARTAMDTTSDEIYANLTILLGKSRSANISYQQQERYSEARLSLQKNAPLGTGYGYRLGIDRSENDSQDEIYGGNAYFQYRGDHGIYSAEGQTVNGNSSYNVGATGGIAVINSSAYYTRPIYDGFALAKVGTLENVEVQYNNQTIGTTDDNGEVLIPSLVSYHRNNISISDRDIPVDYQISAVNRSISLPYRAGVVVDFKIDKVQAFVGKLLIVESGKRSPAEYWGLKITSGSAQHEVLVGKNGEFYLENLSPGNFSAHLFRGNVNCSFELSIPESDAMVVDLGEVSCDKS